MQALAGELKRLANATEGDRNNTLNSVWFKLSQLITAGHLDHDRAHRDVLTTAVRIGLPEAEARRTMDSGTTGAQVKPRTDVPNPTGTPDNVTWLDLARGSAAVQPGADTDEPRDYSNLYLTRSELGTLPTPDPLIDGVLDKRTLFSVTGRDRSYKSFLVLDWLACLATGQPWLGHAAHTTKCLYVVGEGAYGLHTRLTAWEHYHTVTIPDTHLHIRRAPVNLFKGEADVSELIERVQREEYGIVVFDTLQRMSSGADSNHARDAGLIVNSLDRIRQTLDGVTVGMVAHTGKTDDDIRGSSAFEDDIDTVWRVKRDDDDPVIQITLAKRKDGPEGLSYELTPRPVAGSKSVVLERAHGGNVVRPIEGKILATLEVLAWDRRGGGDGMTPTEIEVRTQSNRGAVYRALDHLEDQLLVDWARRGQSRVYSITDRGVSMLDERRTAADQGL